MKKLKIKSMLGRLGAAVLTLSLLSSVTSCGKSQQQQHGGNAAAKPGKVMVIGKADPSEEAFWEDVGKGTSAAAKELNYKVDYKCAKDDSDVETQRKYVSEAIEKEYDAIIIAPNDRDDLNDIFGEAVERGIKILTIDSMTDFSGISCAINASDKVCGEIAANEAAKQLKAQVGKIAGVGKVGIIGHTASTAEVRIGSFKTAFSMLALNDIKNPASAQQQSAAQQGQEEEEELIDPSEAAQKAAAEAKAKGEDPDKAARAAAAEAAKKLEEANVKKAAAAAEAAANAPTEEEVFNDQQRLAEINRSYYIESDRCVTYMDAFNTALKMLQDESNGIKVMYGTSTNTTLGICSAVEELGLEDEVVVVGYNSSEKHISFIKSKVLDATVILNPYNIGYFSVAYAKDLIEGTSIPSTLDTGATLVNFDNIDDPYIQILLYPDKDIDIPETTRPDGAGGPPDGVTTGGAPEGAGGPPDGVTTGGASDGEAGGPPAGVTTGGAPEGAGGPPDGVTTGGDSASNGGNQ